MNTPKARKPQPKKHRVVNRKPAFLKAYRATLQLTAASRATGVDLSTHYKWLKEDPQYRIDYESTLNEIVTQLEDVVMQHATEGVKRKLYYRGKPMLRGKTRSHEYEVEYDHSLALRVLGRHKPGDWRERTEQTVTGSIDIVERLQGGRRKLLEMKRDDSGLAS